MTHQPAISFSISFQHPFNRAGGRTSNVGHNNLMKTRFEARERARELAFKHADIRSIARRLEEEDLGGLLDQNELEVVVAEVKTIQLMEMVLAD